MRVLAIGNSFSQDATRYLHDIAKADGVELEVANLYIGGCSLERHYRNMLTGERAYHLQFDGHMTGFFVSLDDALLSRPWDIVTVQQVSTQSFNADSFHPYIEALVDHIKDCQPKAKLVIHQTWAYEDGSARLEATGYDCAAKMLADIKTAYAQVASELRAGGIIPSGELMGSLKARGIEKVHRDTFHASLGLGRYALGLLWYRMLTGRSVADNTFQSFDEPISDAEQQIAKACVDVFQPIF